MVSILFFSLLFFDYLFYVNFFSFSFSLPLLSHCFLSFNLTGLSKVFCVPFFLNFLHSPLPSPVFGFVQNETKCGTSIQTAGMCVKYQKTSVVDQDSLGLDPDPDLSFQVNTDPIPEPDLGC